MNKRITGITQRLEGYWFESYWFEGFWFEGFWFEGFWFAGKLSAGKIRIFTVLAIFSLWHSALSL